MVQEFKERDASSYDGEAERYGQYIERLSVPLVGITGDLARLRPGDRVLDVGCGTGIATREAARRVAPGGSVLGVDLSAGMIKAALQDERVPGTLDFQVMDAEHLLLPDTAFNSVISHCAVMHFPAVATALNEMRRVLQPSGRLVVSVGYGRPIAPLPLVQHAIRESWRALCPHKTAPRALLRVVNKFVPPSPEPVLTSWAGRNVRAALVRAVERAGFDGIETMWAGNEVRFDDPEEFCAAQLAIVTVARKRLQLVSPEVARAVHDALLNECREVLARNGELTYPYGAFYVSAYKGNGQVPRPRSV